MGVNHWAVIQLLMIGQSSKLAGLAAVAGPLLIGAGGLAAAVALSLQPKDPQVAAGIFPPWWSRLRTFDAAAEAGQVVSLGGAPFVATVRARADAAAALRSSGAWLVVDPGLAAACGA